MKILWVTNWYPSAEAPFRSPFIRAQWLAARSAGVDADLLHIDILRGPIVPKIGWSRGPHGEYILRLEWRWWKFIYHNPWVTAWYLSRTYAGPKPDVVHGQVLLPAGLNAAYLAKHWNRVLVHTEHWNLAPDRLRSGFWGFFGRRAMGMAQLVLPVSEHLARDLSSVLPGTPMKVVPNVMDWSRFHYRATPTLPCASKFRVLSVAHLIPLNKHIKITEWTLEALGILQKRHPEVAWQYVHVGGGPRQRELEDLARGIGLSAQWLGNQEPGAWSEVEADVLVHPTLDETFGMVVYEALHRGLPVLASDIPAFSSWLRPPFGLLVAEGPEAFADALEQFWMNPFAVPEDGFDFKRFEAQEVGTQLQKIYSALLPQDGF